MAKEDISTYLRHILEAIDHVGHHLTSPNFESFENDVVMTGFVTHELTVIGEAANNLSRDFHDQHPDIDWSKIIGMRNWIVHGYFNVNPKILWDTAKQDLPELKKQIEKIV